MPDTCSNGSKELWQSDLLAVPYRWAQIPAASLPNYRCSPAAEDDLCKASGEGVPLLAVSPLLVPTSCTPPSSAAFTALRWLSLISMTCAYPAESRTSLLS